MYQVKHLYLRLIEENDLDFLLTLRADTSLNQYLSYIDNNKVKQLCWHEQYKIRESLGQEYYFAIIDKKLGPIGFVRIYDIDLKSKAFTWGSWILQKENRPKYAALESALLSFEFAFLELQLEKALIQVNLQNIKADNFYKRFGMKFIDSDQINNNYILTKSEYIRLKYSQYIEFFVL